MAGNQPASPEVGQTLGYEHFQVHEHDTAMLKQLGEILPYPRVALFGIELLTMGKEADIMDWFLANWTYSIWYSLVYVLLIVAGKRVMQSRQRFDLRLPLIMWSGSLAIFSIVASIRAFDELFTVAFTHGFYHTVCNPSCFYGVPGFWALVFVISKVVELGDTAFIVLRKQPLIFLHWYHHVTVMVYSWLSFAHHAAPGRWYTIMNLMVHAFMYSYYTARAMRLRIPRSLMMGVTILQLSQMVIGLFVSVYAYRLKLIGVPCHFPTDNMYWAFAMYLSYFLLFSNYFYRAYLKPRPKPVANGSGAVLNGANGVNTKETVHVNGATGHANGHAKSA